MLTVVAFRVVGVGAVGSVNRENQGAVHPTSVEIYKPTQGAMQQRPGRSSGRDAAHLLMVEQSQDGDGWTDITTGALAACGDQSFSTGMAGQQVIQACGADELVVWARKTGGHHVVEHGVEGQYVGRVDVSYRGQ
ncbi:MAG: hypothetical protein CM1200mP26_17040 [Acidimicrobiales bacterium]|nr:MAG: hypothetical protein CM1200mP26_17040 [Acidimicrobiales bacterium]